MHIKAILIAVAIILAPAVHTDLYISGVILTGSGQSVTVNTGITITTAYLYHRINGNGNGSNTISLAEIQMTEQI